MDDNKYDNIKILFNAGVISHINSQILSSFTDFYGFLLGRIKITKNTKSNDSQSNFQQNTLNMIVENVIFIYDKNYLKDKLDKLIDKVTKKYTNNVIIGILVLFYFYVCFLQELIRSLIFH